MRLCCEMAVKRADNDLVANVCIEESGSLLVNLVAGTTYGGVASLIIALKSSRIETVRESPRLYCEEIGPIIVR